MASRRLMVVVTYNDVFEDDESAGSAESADPATGEAPTPAPAEP